MNQVALFVVSWEKIHITVNLCYDDLCRKFLRIRYNRGWLCCNVESTLKQSLLIELPCTNLPFPTVAVRYVISGMIRVLVLLWRGCLPGHDGGSLGWLVLAFRWHWWWLGTIPTCPQADHSIQVAEPAKYSNYIIRACSVASAGSVLILYVPALWLMLET